MRAAKSSIMPLMREFTEGQLISDSTHDFCNFVSAANPSYHIRGRSVARGWGQAI